MSGQRAPKKKGAAPEWRYWDTTVFLAWFLKEPSRLEDCRAVLLAAKKGDVRIVTSALTLTEVIHLKGATPLTEDQEKTLRDFFLHEYISIRVVDRWIAETARTLIWKQGLKPKDAIHAATAVHWKVRILETHDTDLIALDKKSGNPPINIRLPHYSRTLPLPLPASKTKAQS